MGISAQTHPWLMRNIYCRILDDNLLAGREGGGGGLVLGWILCLYNWEVEHCMCWWDYSILSSRGTLDRFLEFFVCMLNPTYKIVQYLFERLKESLS